MNLMLMGITLIMSVILTKCCYVCFCTPGLYNRGFIYLDVPISDDSCISGTSLCVCVCVCVSDYFD